jgi:hypothetical protein
VKRWFMSVAVWGAYLFIIIWRDVVARYWHRDLDSIASAILLAGLLLAFVFRYGMPSPDVLLA